MKILYLKKCRELNLDLSRCPRYKTSQHTSEVHGSDFFSGNWEDLVRVTCEQFWMYVLASEELISNDPGIPIDFDGEFGEDIAGHLRECEQCERLFTLREEQDDERMWRGLEKMFSADRENIRKMLLVLIERVRRSKN